MTTRRWDEERQRMIVEEVHVQVPLDPYLDLRALATYSSLSVRTLQGWLHHPDLPLPHHDVGGKVLVRQSEFDRWVRQFTDRRSLPAGTLLRIPLASSPPSRAP